MIEDLIRKNRCCRRFYQYQKISVTDLEDFINLARLSASAGNLQPLKYIISCDQEKNKEVFSCLKWVAYLEDWDHPKDGEQPPAYIIVIGDNEKAKDMGYDCGIACQSILLGAREKGMAGCIIGTVSRKNLRNFLNLNERYKILLVLAIGKPKEDVMIENVTSDEDIKYWRDAKGVHHVPKRSLKDIILKCYKKNDQDK